MPIGLPNWQNYVDWIDGENFIIRGSYDPITDESEPIGKLQLFPHQRDILGHCLTMNEEEGRLPYTTVIYSCPKKSGKTTISASVGTWASEVLPAGTEIYVMANDFEQAQGRVFGDIAFHMRQSERAVPTKYRIEFQSGTFLQALAQEYKSAAGARHAVTLWDELWGYQSENSRRMYSEMTPIQIPGVPISLRFISTYAGFEGESDLLWELYESIVLKGEPVPELEHITKSNGAPVCFRNGRMFAYWDTEPRMPWQTVEYYSEQMNSLRPHEYLRLHENRWVTTHEQFIPVEWWDEAASRYETSLEQDYKNDRRQIPVIIGVDAGAVRDSTAVVGVQYNYDTGMVDLAFHKIRRPTHDERVDLESAVESYILSMNEQFKIAAVVYDPRHMIRSMQRLERLGLRTVEFTQTARNMVSASEALYDLLRTQRLGAYPADDLRDHIKFAVAEEKGGGFRIVKQDKNSRHHVDGAIALAMACHEALQNHGVDTSQPIRIEHPDSDVSAFGRDEPMSEEEIPLPLRSGNTLTAPPGGWRD